MAPIHGSISMALWAIIGLLTVTATSIPPTEEKVRKASNMTALNQVQCSMPIAITN